MTEQPKPLKPCDCEDCPNPRCEGGMTMVMPPCPMPGPVQCGVCRGTGRVRPKPAEGEAVAWEIHFDCDDESGTVEHAKVLVDNKSTVDSYRKHFQNVHVVPLGYLHPPTKGDADGGKPSTNESEAKP